MPDYVFDNRAPETEQRFGALEVLFDSVTTGHLARYIREGSRCLEVGGGSGSIARWMSERVGARGRVVVTDIDTRFLGELTGPNVEVRQHNIITDTVDEAAFDVVHARLVLVHLPERERAIERMIEALKPGGWLVLQEFDSHSMRPDPMLEEHLLKSLEVLWDVMRARGVNTRYGRELFPAMLRHGLRDVRADGHVTFFRGGSAGAQMMRANIEQMHVAMIETGLLSEHEFDADVLRLDDPSIIWPSPILWTVCGRKPP